MIHPELKEDEYFIGYYTASEYLRIGWTTKRAGSKVCDSEGRELPNTDLKAPVFIKRSEIKDHFGKHSEGFFAGLSDEEKRLNGIIAIKKKQ